MMAGRISRLRLLTICGWVALIAVSSLTLPRAEATELHLASDAWPPFTNEAGEPRFAIDMVQEALRRAGVKARFSILPEFGAVITGLQEARFDGSAALWRSGERETYLLYSRRILENRLILVGRKDSDVSAASFAGLAGKSLAMVGSYAYGETVESAQGPEITEGVSDQKNLELLLQGKVDYILVDDLLMQHVMINQAHEAESFLEIGTNPILRRSLHFGIRRDLPGAGSIIERFNTEILKMLIDGTYNRILQLNWIRTDVDGDGRMELILRGTRAGVAAPGTVYGFRRPGVEGLLVEPPDAPESEEDRYWIDGKMYETWEDVPSYYKTADQSQLDPQKGHNGLFNFKF